MSALDSASFIEAARRIETWKHPLLLTHTLPDGDALGSIVAMKLLLASQGIESTAVLLDPVPNRYAVVNRFGLMPVWNREVTERDLGGFDSVIVLDTCAYKQLVPIADWLRQSDLPKLAVDHHLTRDEVADTYLVDETAAANCLILQEWARACGWPIGRETAAALFIGIAMDTGWFRHSNTDARTLGAAADLAALGADPPGVYQHLFLGETVGRVKLLGAALETLELLTGGRLAVMVLPAAEFIRVGATYVDTEDIVNEPLRIESVVVSVLLVDRGDGIIRVSLRSKAPLSAALPDIDVSSVAQELGGGGHRRAAGVRIAAKLAEARAKIIRDVSRCLTE